MAYVVSWLPRKVAAVQSGTAPAIGFTHGHMLPVTMLTAAAAQLPPPR